MAEEQVLDEAAELDLMEQRWREIAHDEDELAARAERLAERLTWKPGGAEAARVARERAAEHRARANEFRRSAGEARKVREAGESGAS